MAVRLIVNYLPGKNPVRPWAIIDPVLNMVIEREASEHAARRRRWEMYQGMSPGDRPKGWNRPYTAALNPLYSNAE